MKLFLFYFLFKLIPIFSEPLPQKVLICGVCKDVASRLPGSIHIMEKIGSMFSDYRIIVYENNSKDSTKEILYQWKNKNTKVRVLSENVSRNELRKTLINIKSNKQFSISECIARARNQVMCIAELPEYDPYEYMIWMDMDFVLEPNYEGFVEIFTTTQEWDAILAYGIAPNEEFWDWYALRDEKLPLGSESFGQNWWFLKKELFLSQTDPWYPVYSAFGGCGVYKRSSIQGCRYSGIVTPDLAELVQTILHDPKYEFHSIVQEYKKNTFLSGKIYRISLTETTLQKIPDETAGILIADDPYQNIWRMSSEAYHYPSVCEHATFHASMITKGFHKLYINPRLIFRYGG